MAAWSFYEANRYSQATAALDRFIELDPKIRWRNILIPESVVLLRTNRRCRT